MAATRDSYIDNKIDKGGKQHLIAKELNYNIQGLSYDQSIRQWFFLDDYDIVAVKDNNGNVLRQGFMGLVKVGSDNAKHHNLTTHGGVLAKIINGQEYRYLNDAGLNTTPHIKRIPSATDTNWCNYITRTFEITSAYYELTLSQMYGIIYQIGTQASVRLPYSGGVIAAKTSKQITLKRLNVGDNQTGKLISLVGFAMNSEGQYTSPAEPELRLLEPIMADEPCYLVTDRTQKPETGVRTSFSMTVEHYNKLEDIPKGFNQDMDYGIMAYKTPRLYLDPSNYLPSGMYAYMFRDSEYVAIVSNGSVVNRLPGYVIPIAKIKFIVDIVGGYTRVTVKVPSEYNQRFVLNINMIGVSKGGNAVASDITGSWQNVVFNSGITDGKDKVLMGNPYSSEQQAVDKARGVYAASCSVSWVSGQPYPYEIDNDTLE